MEKRRKAVHIVANVFMFFGGLALIGSGLAKLAHVPKVVTQMGAFGFDGNRLMLIAVIEIVSAALFLVPITRSIGLLLVSAYMGGAIATHIGHGQSPIQPAFLLTLIWLVAWLRHPQILWSLDRHRFQPPQNSRQQHTANRQAI
jgi:hypothetical protein